MVSFTFYTITNNNKWWGTADLKGVLCASKPYLMKGSRLHEELSLIESLESPTCLNDYVENYLSIKGDSASMFHHRHGRQQKNM